MRLERIADVATRGIGSTTSIIVHTILFIVSFLLPALEIISFEKMLLTLTTIVSLEAIYLAIFIQMSVNKNSQDIENIQEDVEEIQEDIEEIQEDVEEIQEDVEEIQEDVDEIQEDVEELQDEEEELPQAVKPFTSIPIASISAHEHLVHIQALLIQLQDEINAMKSAK